MVRLPFVPLLAATLVFLVVLPSQPGTSFAEVGQLGCRYEPYHFNSGTLSNLTPASAPLRRRTIALADTIPWLRLIFTSAILGDGSVLRITSLHDGSSQTLNAARLKEWNNTSAYFNGSAVLLELIGGPGTAQNSVTIDYVLVGAPAPSPKSICGDNDSRVRAYDAAVGRVLIGPGECLPPGSPNPKVEVCSAFIIDQPESSSDKLLLSAGHCFYTGTTPDTVPAIVQFPRVDPGPYGGPLSESDCDIQHPPCDKQFPVIRACMRGHELGPGFDYAVFRVGRNDFGLTAYEEQQTDDMLHSAKHIVPPPAGTCSLRVTGYGTDNNELATGGTACSGCTTGTTGTFNCIEQTDQDIGRPDTEVFVGTQVRHRVDTCPGNSGSPIILRPGIDEVVGIHTHPGCPAPDYNRGTATNHPGLLADIGTVASGCPPPVPSYSQWTNATLVGALALLGVLFLWRRRLVVQETSSS